MINLSNFNLINLFSSLKRKQEQKAKAQGAMEYLLIIGGALLIAVLVVVIVLNLQKGRETNVDAVESQYTTFIDNAIIPPIVTDIDCNVSGKTKVWINASPSPGVTNYTIVVDNNYSYINTISSTINSSNGYLQFTSSQIGINDENKTKYEIAIIAIKDNKFSPASEPVMNCEPYR
ncbi:MAG: hypothetical protein V1824_01520 [archaeon]